MNISKITLGTAQLGLNYGISNINGKPDFKTSLKLLKFSYENGITSFDTAPAYGNSEKILGTFISSHIKKLNQEPVIISKLPAVNIKDKITFDVVYEFIKRQINHSLDNLKLESIPIYLLHHAPDIFLKDGIVIECLDHIRNEGLIKHFGVSIYNLSEVKAVLNYKEIDSIQIPINLFDHRVIKANLLKELRKKKFIIFARSIFLQGLFFKNPNALHAKFELAKKPLTKLNEISNQYNISIAKLAFLFVRDLPEITSIVLGAEKIDQIKENLNYLLDPSLPKDLSKLIIEEFKNLPEIVINPSLWEK
jgi:aryl-alcohol dehydrogenase-like predicted oxidoreductase